MSSWLSISLPNPFKPSQSDPSPSPETSSDDHGSPGGVKDDLSVLGQTIGRQLRGVAAFLAPPPPPPSSAAADPEASVSETLLGIRNDLVEISGSFKSGALSLFSTNKAVTEISRLASSLLQIGDEGDSVDGDDGSEASEAAGVSDEVVEFVREISLRPECWTDFPSSADKDFAMSDAQREHASTIEHLVPNLAALRNKLHSILSVGQFWMIYFILLLPRLNEHDSKLLSSPEIVDAREMLLQQLRNSRNAPTETSEDSETINSSQEGGKSPIQENVMGPVNTAPCTDNDDHGNAELGLDNEDINTCTSEDSRKQPETEEDVSFSDLEDDDNDLSGFRRAHSCRDSSPSESNEWVQLGHNSGMKGVRQQTKGQSSFQGKDSEGEESNDWLTVDDRDFDSLV